MNNINSIQALIESKLSANKLDSSKSKLDTDVFNNTFNSAIEKLNNQQIGAEKESVKALVGETPDLHQTIVTLQTTEMQFQFALQVRNKLLNAYEEVMRMQV